MKWINNLKLALKTSCQVFIVTYLLYRYTIKRLRKMNIQSFVMNSSSIKTLILIELTLLIFLFLICLTIISLRPELGYKTTSNIKVIDIRKKVREAIDLYFYQPLKYCDQIIEDFLLKELSILTNFCIQYLIV